MTHNPKIPKPLPDLVKLRLEINQAILSNADENILDKLLTNFIHGYAPLGVSESHSNIWWRARDNLPTHGRCDYVQQLTYKPGGSDKYGRASRPRTEVLYAAWNPLVALDEIHAKPQDLIHLTAVRVAAPDAIPAFIVGAYQMFFASGRVDRFASLVDHIKHMSTVNPELYFRNVFIDSSLAEWFRDRVSEDETHKYKITALFSEKIYSGGGPILYPSVQHAGGWNLAILGENFDPKFEVLDTRVVSVDEKFGFGLYKLRPLHYSCSFQSDGAIEWNNNTQLDASWTHIGGMKVSHEHRGWRKGLR